MPSTNSLRSCIGTNVAYVYKKNRNIKDTAEKDRYDVRTAPTCDNEYVVSMSVSHVKWMTGGSE